MAFATYTEPKKNPSHHSSPTEDLSTSKAMGKVYLYMGVALLLTAAVAIGVGFLFAGWMTNWSGAFTLPSGAISSNNPATFVYFGALIASFIGIIVSGIALQATVARGKSSVWVPYILYAIFMGVIMSAFLIAGIDFVTLGEAFGISAVAFAIMGTIGYFSKKNLNPLGMVALSALFMLSFFGLSFWLFFLFTGLYPTLFSIIYSIVIMLVLLIMVAVDTYNVKKIVERGAATTNIYLYCAYVMYTDFINILIRVIILLSRFRRN